MLTLAKATSMVLEALSQNTDDSQLDTRYIQDILLLNRSVALSNTYNRNRSFDEIALQTICIELELVNSTTCCASVVSPCLILRSTKEVPLPLDLHQSLAVSSITTSLVIGKPINFVNHNRASFLGKTAATNSLLYAFIYNKYLYLYSLDKKNLLIDSVNMTAVFTDFIEAADYECKDGTTCWTDDTLEFKCPQNLFTTIVLPQTINTLMLKLSMVGKDEDNNAKGDIEQMQQSSKKQQQ